MKLPWRKKEVVRDTVVFCSRFGVIAAYLDKDLIGAIMQVGPRSGLMIFTDVNVPVKTGSANDLKIMANNNNYILENAGGHYLYVPFTNMIDEKEMKLFGHLIQTNF